MSEKNIYYDALDASSGETCLTMLNEGGQHAPCVGAAARDLAEVRNQRTLVLAAGDPTGEELRAVLALAAYTTDVRVGRAVTFAGGGSVDARAWRPGDGWKGGHADALVVLDGSHANWTRAGAGELESECRARRVLLSVFTTSSEGAERWSACMQ